MAIEKYVAIASLGLFVMFVGEIISIYHFMIEPPRDIDADAKILQFISIGVAPAVILVGTVFIMVKRHGSKLIGGIIVAGGAVLLIGMFYANTLVEKIDQNHLVFSVTTTPPLFMIVSIPVIITGLVLFKIKKKKPKKEYL